MANNRIQGQRGVIQSPGGQAAQSDSYSQQIANLPRNDTWYLSPFQPYDALQSAPMTANTLHLIYLPDRERQSSVTYARIRVGTTDASGNFLSGLYLYNSALRTFAQIPNTSIAFSLASAGNITNKLRAAAVIDKNDKVFLGCISTSATGSMFGLSWTPWHFGSVLTVAATSLPTSVLLSQCSKNYTSYVAAVTYLSDAAYQVL